MPEYLAPGVYVEETSFRAKSIEGVSTSTAGFVGPARFGPIEGEPELLTSFADFERIYGGLDQLDYSGTRMTNYLAHGVRAFFEEGGKRLYVSRVYNSSNGSGRASATISNGGSPPGNTVTVQARYPGAAGNVAVTFAFRIGQNILGSVPVDPGNAAAGTIPVLRGARNYDLVWVGDTASPPSSLADGELYWLERYFDDSTQRYTFRLRQNDPDQNPDPAAPALADVTDVRIVTVTVTVGAMGKFGQSQSWENLSFHPDHTRALTKVFAADPVNRATALFVPLSISTTLENGAAIAEVLLSQPSATSIDSPALTILETLADAAAGDAARTFQVQMTGGSDGTRPGAADYEGDDGGSSGLKSGLRAFEDIEDISIVAAPGSSFGYENGYQSDGGTILRHLISHCERMRYRVAVLDAGDRQLVSQIRAYRAQLDSTHAALYYPWIRLLDPITEEEIHLPPSGFVTGIYARNDVDNGVHKAPANEVVRLAIGFESMINKGQQDVLNPEGINCFRFFEGRGFRLWGARTISSDPEWKYVNVRRYFAYLERSIERGTQFAVFENNGPALWSNVRRTIEDFLFNEWKSGRLLGEKVDEAFFVRCDRSTMTQNDLDNGRMICLIGVSVLKPAEFVIFRIGQFTADATS